VTPAATARVIIAPALLAEIARAAERAWPGECCGLLVGRDEGAGGVRVERVVASDNVAHPPRADRFEVDPAVRFAVMRDLADTDLRIVGHHHSHPDGPAEPSRHDLAQAFEPELVWLITAVTTGRARETTAWRLDAATGRVCRLDLAAAGPEARER